MKPLVLPLALAVALVASSGPGSPAQSDEELLARAANYAKVFFARFSSVVAEERYTHDAVALHLHRELVSDFLLVKREASDDWLAFRDVFAVDGLPVRDRQDRLMNLFLAPAATTLDEAERIAREGARHNLGGARRTINHPLLALAFVQPRYQPRFRFKIGKLDSSVTPVARVTEYQERARPTLLRSADNFDMPANGSLWIDQNSGQVVKTELVVQGSERITTTFREDGRLQIAVPVEMRESFVRGGLTYTGTATYGRFRRFGVETRESVEPQEKVR